MRPGRATGPFRLAQAAMHMLLEGVVASGRTKDLRP
jgi:hypothetical protein